MSSFFFINHLLQGHFFAVSSSREFLYTKNYQLKMLFLIQVTNTKCEMKYAYLFQSVFNSP